MYRLTHFSPPSADTANFLFKRGGRSILGKVTGKAGHKVASKVADTVADAGEVAGEVAGDVAGQGFWAKAGPIMEAVGLATLPASLAPMFVESKDTRALKAIREEDKMREAMKLGRLPMTESVSTKIKAIG